MLEMRAVHPLQLERGLRGEAVTTTPPFRGRSKVRVVKWPHPEASPCPSPFREGGRWLIIKLNLFSPTLNAQNYRSPGITEPSSLLGEDEISGSWSRMDRMGKFSLS